MGASDWAGRMCRDLEDEFGICGDRALRLTTLIRYFHEDGYRELLGARDTNEYDRRWRRLQADLPEELRAQDGETIEERWNELMDDMDVTVGLPTFNWPVTVESPRRDRRGSALTAADGSLNE